MTQNSGEKQQKTRGLLGKASSQATCLRAARAGLQRAYSGCGGGKSLRNLKILPDSQSMISQAEENSPLPSERVSAISFRMTTSSNRAEEYIRIVLGLRKNDLYLRFIKRLALGSISDFYTSFEDG